MSVWSKYAWIPYTVLCVGILMLFATEEWMLLYNYSRPVRYSSIDDDKRLFRRDLNSKSMGTIFNFALLEEIDKQNELEKNYYSNILNDMLKEIKNKKERDHLRSLSEDQQTDKKISETISEESWPKELKMSKNGPPNLEKITSFSSSVPSASADELLQVMKPLGSPPVNSKFIFHNKIPKAGSTTMKWLLVALAKRNGFILDHARWCLNEDQSKCGEHDPKTGQHLDGPDAERSMVEYIPKKMAQVGQKNFLLLKHHHWFNFTKFNLQEPTYINVVRDPVTRYSSWYYFERYGWKRNEGSRSRFFGNEQDKVRTLDECVQGQYPECLEPLQVLIKYFCGTDMKKCGMMSNVGHDWTKVAEATERAKQIIAREFYVVGVLEHFSTTLALFEKMLPEYFAGAAEVSERPEQRKQRESSKSLNPGFSNSTRKILETGVLRYEVDIYNLVKSLFHQKLKFYQIPLV